MIQGLLKSQSIFSTICFEGGFRSYSQFLQKRTAFVSPWMRAQQQMNNRYSQYCTNICGQCCYRNSHVLA